jgi:hypothetical protein
VIYSVYWLIPFGAVIAGLWLWQLWDEAREARGEGTTRTPSVRGCDEDPSGCRGPSLTPTAIAAESTTQEER